MRQLSVIPPMMFDSEQRRVKFINMNGLMDDPMKVYKSRQFMNVWTEHEKEIFKEKWVTVAHVGMCECVLHFLNFVSSVVQVYAASKELRADSFISGEKGGFLFLWFSLVWWIAVTPRTGCSPVDVLTEALFNSSFTDSDHTSPPTDSFFCCVNGIFFSNSCPSDAAVFVFSLSLCAVCVWLCAVLLFD